MKYKLYDINKKEHVTCDFFVSADFLRILILVELDIDENYAYFRTLHRSKRGKVVTKNEYCGSLYGDRYILQKENE